MTSRWRIIRRRLDALDARVEDAKEKAETATREAEISERRREIIYKNVVEPLREIGAHNQFAELIRYSITIGHGHRGAA